jgi:hypothetical protein
LVVLSAVVLISGHVKTLAFMEFGLTKSKVKESNIYCISYFVFQIFYILHPL